MAADSVKGLRVLRAVAYVAAWGFTITGSPIDGPLAPSLLVMAGLSLVVFFAIGLRIAASAVEREERMLRMQLLVAGTLCTASMLFLGAVPSGVDESGALTNSPLENAAVGAFFLTLIWFIIVGVRVRKRFPRRNKRAQATPIAQPTPVVPSPAPAPAPVEMRAQVMPAAPVTADEREALRSAANAARAPLGFAPLDPSTRLEDLRASLWEATQETEARRARIDALEPRAKTLRGARAEEAARLLGTLTLTTPPAQIEKCSAKLEALIVLAELDALRSKHPALRDADPLESALRADPPDVRRASEGMHAIEERLAQRAQLADGLAQLRKRLKNLSTQLAEGRISESAFERARSDLEADRNEVEEKLHQLDGELFRDEFEKPI